MTVLALDVGEKRIGVATGDSDLRIAMPYDTISVDGNELTTLLALIEQEGVRRIIVGYPRNQSGEVTQQSQVVEQFVSRLEALPIEGDIIYQDESLTSVLAKERLDQLAKPYQKADIDAMAACIILEDYFGR